MNLKDIYQISKELNKNNKKETKNVIIGLCLSLTITILFFYLIISFVTGFYGIANKCANLSAITVSFDDEYKGNYGGVLLEHYNDVLSSNYKDKIEYSETSINYEYKTKSGVGAFTKYYTHPTITIDNNPINIEYKEYNDGKDIFLAYDTSLNKNIYFSSENEYLNKYYNSNVILAGTTFTSDVKEIMISNLYLDDIGITNYNSVIGKNISYKIKLYDKSKSETLNYDGDIDYNQEIYIFKEYKIVGVFDINIYNCPSRNNYSFQSEKDAFSFPQFWVKKESIKSTTVDVEEKDTINDTMLIYSYNEDPIIEFSKIVDDGYILKPLGFNSSGFGDNDLRSSKKVVFQFDNLIDEYHFLGTLDKYCLNKDASLYGFSASYNLRAFIDFYPMFLYLTIIFLVFGIILFIASIINIVKVISYSVKKDMSFFSVITSIGANIKDIRLIYQIRLLLQFIKSLIISAIITTLISLLFSIVLSLYLNSDTYGGFVKYNISFIYFPLVLIGVIIIYIVILYLISYILIKKNKFNNLIENMKGEVQ